MEILTVEFRDGLTQKYKVCNTLDKVRVENGCLTFSAFNNTSGIAEYHIPINAIRTWKIENK